MTKVIIRTNKVEGFFDRAQKAAQKADRGESFKKLATFSFEDPQEIFMVLSKARRRLMLEVMDKPKTITKDIGLLERLGLLVSQKGAKSGAWCWEAGKGSRTKNRDDYHFGLIEFCILLYTNIALFVYNMIHAK